MAEYYALVDNNGVAQDVISTNMEPTNLPKGYRAVKVSSVWAEALEEMLDDIAAVEHVCGTRIKREKDF
jgi:hypothetical protein